jgi:membrane protease YdiL (CAAX protease family)
MNQLINVNQIFLQRTAKSKLSKFFLFPLIRIIIAVLFLFPVTILHNLFVSFVLKGIDEPLNSILYFAETVVFILLLVYSYSLYTKYIENRKMLEFNLTKWYKESGKGILLGGGMVIYLVLLLALTGFYKVEQTNSAFILITGIFRYGIGSFVEELIFTIIFFKLVEEFTGTIISIILTSLLFGFMHLGNDNSTILSSIYTGLVHIIILAPFILTRRIWMVWAIHFSWNFFQTAVFGMNNSGMIQDGFITPTIEGADWITGGAYGVEASYISLFLQILIGILILLQAVKSKQIVKASWKRA